MTLDKATLFAYISLAIFILALLLMPKRLNRKEIYTTWFVMACLTLNTDLIFGLILDLYDFIYPDITLSDLILQAALPPAAGILALNFQPQKNSHFLFYLILVVCCSLLFEWISVLFGYLIYKGWRMWYSIPFYALGLLYLRWHLQFLRRPN